MAVSKINYTHIEAENLRYDAVTHIFEPANSGDWGKGGVQSIQHNRTPITANHFSDEIAIGLSNDSKAIERATNLLAAGGFDRSILGIQASGSEAYITIPKASTDDLIRAVSALATTVENPRGAAYYAMLSPEIVHGIADIAAEKMGISPLFSISSLEMEGGRASALGLEHVPRHYTDVDMQGYSPSPVRFIRGDYEHIDRDGKLALAPCSALSVDPERIPLVRSAFKQAGIAHQVMGDTHINASASPADIVRALGAQGVIPNHFARTLDAE